MATLEGMRLVTDTHWVGQDSDRHRSPHWPPKPWCFRPRQGQCHHPNRPPLPHRGGGHPPTGPRFPWRHPPPRGSPHPGGGPPPAWSPVAPSFLPGQFVPKTSVPAWAVPTPPSAGMKGTGGASTGTMTTSSSVAGAVAGIPLDTRFIQNSSVQGLHTSGPSSGGPIYPTSTLEGPNGADPSIHMFPFGPQSPASQFGGSPNFPTAPHHTWTGQGF